MMKRARGLAAALWMVALMVTAQAPAKGPTPAPAPPAAKPPETLGQTLIDQDELANAGRAYTYDPAGRRDPFRSLLIRQPNRPGGQRPAGIAGIGVDEVIVQGIWKTRAGFVAQIRGADNKSYLLRPGDLLYDGEVTRVGSNEVTFRQNLSDPQSVKPFRDVTKQLNATIR
jgi:hypothetical protein